MRITEVDERSIDDEVGGPVFRVFLYRRRGTSFACEVQEIADADVSEVIAWARRQAADLYAVALMTTCGDQLQARWIDGTDPNNRPCEPIEQAARDRMFERFGILDPG